MIGKILFQYGNWTLTFGQLLIYLLFTILFTVAVFSLRSLLWSKLQSVSEEDNPENSKILKRTFYWIVLVVFVLCSVIMLNLDYTFSKLDSVSLSISLILQGLLVFQAARLIDWFLIQFYLKKYYSQRTGKLKSEDINENVSSASQIVKYILYAIAAIIIVRILNLDYALYSHALENGQVISLKITNIISAVLVLLFARFLIWVVTQIIMYGLYRQNSIDIGAQYAINQLLKYVIYFIAVFVALDELGINMTLIWGGAAALLVGLGLGLQQTFNDFFSGIVLLFERSVSVGDTLDFEGEVGIVKKIGLRSSILETRGNMTIIMPNSQLVNQQVLNWNHYNDRVRFEISVGVAYGSDTALVKKLLLDAIIENPNVLKYPKPFVRFENFGDSSLDFKTFFFSKKLIEINDIRSDLRFSIDKLFRENNISIPFPQRDINIKQD